ncbi:UDP-N-acetylglucosamine 2-epimerase (non-hydrolysing) [Methylomarinovum caldicuralii]|uniref:UDP-N-acetylglucosamine 2-epimerase (Non-hydrolysing) n=1 Tax=Methylomarinovum caldicuralii TaxID=438856 RepID=A0AAU9C7Y6_9GAMM|nr:UDP-N-acetylglucosamine 2-epimerase (non-hydrolyzing) [Methylomarinovum caldicuralii]BCX82154.1 UDP-N-acetylglucosamine 2-epimerase (non-hydrolysing) [Methylomarinovum caldicuralii]
MTATILCVVGARPNFMKIAPIHAQLRRSGKLRPFLVHTGQHYDAAMKDAFFTQLGIPEPDVDLGVGSGSHAWQTAQIMQRFEPVLDEAAPEAVLVVGDVNSTIACGLVAAKKQIPLIHVEAGLRSRDRTMPEEINRVLTDQISDLLFTTERSARDNLTAEGIDPSRIHFVGNVMIDALRAQLERAMPAAQTLQRHGRALPPQYGVVTLHRPANVDDPDVLARLLNVLAEIGRRLPLVFPCHPRTLQKIEAFGLQDMVEGPAITLLPPLGYLEMLGLVKDARLVLTDSGGLQEETTALGIPCITLRDNTERPITVTEGTNTLAGRDPERIRRCADEVLAGGGKRGRVPELWDGRAAERIVTILERHWG